MSDHGAWGGKPLTSEKDWRKGSEYGGQEGIIQPLDSPHTASLSAREVLMMVLNTPPTEPIDTQVPEPLKRLA